MTTLHEAAQKALDALENRCGTHAEERGPDGAITALRTALAKQLAEQEPVAWANINKNGDITYTSNKMTPWAKTPLYTTPQPRTCSIDCDGSAGGK
jgi:hypothetical protein